jgi:hypothetical protein
MRTPVPFVILFYDAFELWFNNECKSTKDFWIWQEFFCSFSLDGKGTEKIKRKNKL